MSDSSGTIQPPTPAVRRKPGPPKEPLTTEQQQQATTLSAAGWSQTKIARTIGRSRSAVKHCLEKPEAIAEVRDERAELVELYRDAARAILVSIDSETIAKANLLQRATSSGIFLDKSLLLAGQPTSINVVALMDVLGAIRAQDAVEDERHLQAKALLSSGTGQ